MSWDGPDMRNVLKKVTPNLMEMTQRTTVLTSLAPGAVFLLLKDNCRQTRQPTCILP